MKLAVSLATAGMSLRQAASAVGFKDHNEIARTLHRYGLAEIHNQRQREVQAARRHNVKEQARRFVELLMAEIEKRRRPPDSSAQSAPSVS